MGAAAFPVDPNVRPTRRRLLAAAALGAGMRAGPAPAADDLVPPPGTAVFADAADLGAALVPSAVRLVWLAGRRRSGRGAGWYERVPGPARLLPSLQSRDGAWWRLSPGERLDAAQFGAVADGVADDTAALQAMIDCALYELDAPKNVLLPAGLYRTTDTLHIGYGDRYVTLRLSGEPMPHPDGHVGVTSMLLPDFADRPCLNVQGGRRVRIESLTLRGLNHAYLATAYETLRDRTDRALWAGPRLGPGANARTAPYAGLCIDGYAGPMPAEAYPPVRTPAWLGPQTPYDRAFSSQGVVENCTISGFCVGAVLQPGRVPDASNGDFFTWRDCDLSFNIVGLALCQSDARCNNLENCRLHFNHTAIDSVSYGNGHGQCIGLVSGCSFDNNAQIVDIDTAGVAPQRGSGLTFEACYAESLYRIGNFLAPGKTGPGIAFRGCKFQFSIKEEEFSPASLLSGPGGTARIEDCVFLGGFGLFGFDCDLVCDGLVVDQLQAGGAFDLTSRAGRTAVSFTAGVWAARAHTMRLSPGAFFDEAGAAWARSPGGLSGAAFPVATPGGAQPPAAMPIPWWVKALDDGAGCWRIGPTLCFDVDRAALPLKDLDVSGSEVRFHVDEGGLRAAAGQGPLVGGLIGRGDIVRDEAADRLYYVVALAAVPQARVLLTLRRLTGLRSRDHGRNWEMDAPLRTDVGTLTFFVARRFSAAPHRLALRTTAGSSWGELHDARFGGGAPVALALTPGDGLVVARRTPGAAGAFHQIASARAETGQVVFTQPLPFSFSGDCPAFVRNGLA